MKIVKPLTLGILQKPYRHRRKHHYVVTALGFFRLGTVVDRFLAEQMQWPILIKSLPPNEPLDFAMPKGRGEMLLSGNAYAPNKKAVPWMTVRASVGAVDKRLSVVGDREWMYGLVPLYRVTPPVPFTSMPLGYDRAYGGADYPANPLGRGYSSSRLPALRGENRGLMPNIEYPDDPVRSNRKNYAPAGFGPTDIRSPARQAKAGTYDQAWLDNDFPGLPEDVQWTLYNAAPEDQQIDGYFAGGEPYRIEGMHPSLPVIQGALPSMRVRAFLQRNGQVPDAAEELPMVFDTVWFFPHDELGVAIYRGQAEIADSDALDVESVMLAYEDARHAPRSLAHYREALRGRTDRVTAALHLTNDAPLIPEISADVREARAKARADKEAADLAQRQAELDESMAEFWAKSGMTPPADYVPPKASPISIPVVTPEAMANGEVDLTDFVAQAEALGADAKKRGEAKFAELEQMKASMPLPPVSAQAVVEQIREAEARASLVAHDLVGGTVPPPAGIIAPRDLTAEERQRLQAVWAQLPALQRQSRRIAPKPTAPAVALAPEVALHLGRKAREWHAAGVCLAGRDLAGAQLTKANFDGADLREAMFEQADLSGTSFRGANLRGAVFAGATLRGADFTGADLSEASFNASQAKGAIFRDANLAKAFALEADWTEADFTGADLTSVTAYKAVLTGATLEKANLALAMLVEAIADAAQFTQARFSRTVLLGAKLEKANFSNAELERTIFLNVQAAQSLWRGARLTRSQTGGTASFANADLRDMKARECGWRGADLRGADFSGAQLAICDFGLCRFDGARLRGALLWRSILMQATFAECDADDADFFQAMCRKADFRGASLRGINRAQADFSEALLGALPPNNAPEVRA